MGEILGDFLQRQFIGDERGNMDHKRERGGIYWRGLTKRGESAIGADRKGISSGRSRARESFGSYRAFPLRKTSGLFYGAVKYDLGFN